MPSAKQGSYRYHFFKVFWYDSTRGMNPRSTDCEADALTTTPSRRCAGNVLQWNAGGLRARRPKLLRFISSHPVDLIYIQDSNLNLSTSFWIPGFSALQFHGTQSRSGIFSTDVADASGGVIIFVKQGLFFSELSTSSLSSLGPYSDYVEVNISLNDFSSSLSFLNVYAPLIRSSTKDSRTNFFSLSILPSYVEAEAVDFSRFRFRRKSTASASLIGNPLSCLFLPFDHIAKNVLVNSKHLLS